MSPRGASFKRVYSSTMDTIPFIDFEVKYDGIKNNQIAFFVKDAVPGTNGNAGSFDTVYYPADSTLIMLKGRLRMLEKPFFEDTLYHLSHQNIAQASSVEIL